MQKNKKGFTLIELLSVIVILGILMIVAIPAVTKYIEKSKKEAFIKEINSLVDTVRYGISSGDSNYQHKTIFDIADIDLEKGKKTVKSGLIIVNTGNNNYRVKVAEQENNYCINEEISNLDDSKIQDCNTGYEYVIGEDIRYAGSNWKVIQNSKFKKDDDNDYVVLLKEKVLTNTELGDFAYESGYDTTRFISTSYSTSNVKKALDKYMENYLDESNLKLVDGYKIRTVKVDDLKYNLGWKSASTNSSTSVNDEGNDVPSFVYNNFGEGQNCVFSYWTMNFEDNSVIYIWHVHSNGNLYVSSKSFSYGAAVRPVINLKKSAIKNN